MEVGLVRYSNAPVDMYVFHSNHVNIGIYPIVILLYSLRHAHESILTLNKALFEVIDSNSHYPCVLLIIPECFYCFLNAFLRTLIRIYSYANYD